jgi:hypothetical protein
MSTSLAGQGAVNKSSGKVPYIALIISNSKPMWELLALLRQLAAIIIMMEKHWPKG